MAQAKKAAPKKAAKKVAPKLVAQKARENEAFLKGVAIAAAVTLQRKRKADRENQITLIGRKLTNRGIKRDELVAAIEAVEKAGSRIRKAA